MTCLLACERNPLPKSTNGLHLGGVLGKSLSRARVHDGWLAALAGIIVLCTVVVHLAIFTPSGYSRAMKTRVFVVGLVVAVGLSIGCPPPPPPPPKDACSSISIPSIGPGSGESSLCVLPSECREDTMTQKLDATFCNDKSGGSCPTGNSACSNSCVGVVLNSGLQVTPGSCTWDRNSECKTASGVAGSNCMCKWTIPAGSALTCGCGCK